MKNLVAVLAGFLGGILYVVACDTSVHRGIAQDAPEASVSSIRAADVTYDNTTSSLTTTNVQAAIDEVVREARAFESRYDFAAQLVGRWQLQLMYSLDPVAGIVTFNADGTYTSENMVDNNFSGMCSAGQYTLVPNGMLVMSACGDHNPFHTAVGFSGGKLYLGKDSRHAYEGTRL